MLFKKEKKSNELSSTVNSYNVKVTTKAEEIKAQYFIKKKSMLEQTWSKATTAKNEDALIVQMTVLYSEDSLLSNSADIERFYNDVFEALRIDADVLHNLPEHTHLTIQPTAVTELSYVFEIRMELNHSTCCVLM